MTKSNQPILIICGPTASGKTSLALDVANLLPQANILSVDSRQVYKELDIITGKDIPKDLPKSIKFFGLDLIEANQTINLADFVKYANQVISDSLANKTPLIVVGGTGLYLKAITSTLSDITIPPNESLRSDLEKLSIESLQNLLFDINPEKLISLNNSDIYNPRRLIRAIEVSKYSLPVIAPSPPLAEGARQPSSNFVWVGLKNDKDRLRANIQKRVIDRLENGAIEEVQNLLKKYPNATLSIFTSLGVKEIVEYLEGKVSKEQLIDSWTNSEVDYARRQMVWFKKQPDIIWYDKDKQTLATQLIKTLQNND